MEIIKFDMINSIGMELFRKNNSTFLKDSLSPIMSRIFKAANLGYVTNTDSVYYMKSGVIHNRVFYIYSDELAEKNPEKICDVVNFNNEECVWIYSKNAINMIDKDPYITIMVLYRSLVNTLIPESSNIFNSFIRKEKEIIYLIMFLYLVIFLNETYGALDVDTCKNIVISELDKTYTNDSINSFINDVCKNYNNKTYITNREYLDSYLLLVKN